MADKSAGLLLRRLSPGSGVDRRHRSLVDTSVQPTPQSTRCELPNRMPQAHRDEKLKESHRATER